MEWGRKHRWALLPCGRYQTKLVFKNCQVSALLRGLSVRLKCSSFPSRNLSALYSDIKKLSEGLAWSWKRRECLLPWDSRRSLETGAREVRRSLGKDAAVSLHLLSQSEGWLGWGCFKCSGEAAGPWCISLQLSSDERILLMRRLWTTRTWPS